MQSFNHRKWNFESGFFLIQIESGKDKNRKKKRGKLK